MKLSGNRGEWSELYALVKLLSMGRLHAADEKLQMMQNVYFPIRKIFKTYEAGKDVEYTIELDESLNSTRKVKVCIHGDLKEELSQEQLRTYAEQLFEGIIAGKGRSFEIAESEEIVDSIQCTRIKAKSDEKADIKMAVHDYQTGYEMVCGFSIKSYIGNAPTLLNASGATNYAYLVNGISDEDARRINAIETDEKINERTREIIRIGSMRFNHMLNSVFARNLMMIDLMMPQIVADILYDSYTSGITDLKTLVERQEEKNPLGLPTKGIYTYKIKKLLSATALGMKPATEWDGHDEANGGYIIVKDDGEVVAYHIYNRDAFETYLYETTALEKGSTKKHNFATIYRGADGNMYYNLNLQIRFKKQ